MDITKIKAALDWLIANNHLYKNIKINVDGMQNHVQIIEVQIAEQNENRNTPVSE